MIFIPISKETLGDCASRGFCQIEAAKVLGVSLSTFRNRLAEDADLRAVWDAGIASARKRAEEAAGRPTKFERRFFVNLKADLAERIMERARAEDRTPHAVAVEALEAFFR